MKKPALTRVKSMLLVGNKRRFRVRSVLSVLNTDQEGSEVARTLVLILAFALNFAACATLSSDPVANSGGDDGDTEEQVSQSPESDDSKVVIEDAEDVDQDDEDLGDVDNEIVGGFCRDDIYTIFLRQEFIRSQGAARSTAAKAKRIRSGKKENFQRSESEALHYVRNRLNGPVSSYFGAIPVAVQPRVDFWVNYFMGNGRRTYLKWLVRSMAVKDLVLPALQQEGLPVEFLYLSMVESGFSAKAKSRAKAIGPWQFMSGTAKLYGLRINYWVDERRDFVKSTVAAAKYLRDLYEEFGDWHLAMASYNAGPGKIRRAIRAVGSRDFWKIAETRHIRVETKDYVPKVLAALILAASAEKNGFATVGEEVNDFTTVSAVEVNSPVRLADVAQNLGVSVSLLRDWNPELIRDITPPLRDGATYGLKIPERLKSKFFDIRSQLADVEISDVLLHTIKQGDTISGIAKKYGVSSRQIIEVNPDLRTKALRIGRSIAVPVPSIKVVKAKESV